MFRGSPRQPGAHLEPVAAIVSDRVWRAMIDSSRLLGEMGIRHALVGGLAVGAHGWPRATKDVDFLVDDSAWIEKESGLLVMRAGLPVQAHGVPIDTLSVRNDEKHLLAAIEAPEISQGIPVAPVEALVYMKLVSPRAKDRVDVLELVRSGIDVESVRAYLEAHAPRLGAKFDETVAAARAEEDAE